MSRRAVLKVRPYPKNPQKDQPQRWVIDYRVFGKRERKFFDSKASATAALDRIKIKLNKEGCDALSLSDTLRVMAVDGDKELKPFGKTISDAVKWYVKHLEACERSITVQALVEKYLIEKKDKSAVHQQDLRNRFNRFCLSFGPRLVHTISTQEIKDWINALELGPLSFNNWRDRLGFLFGHAVENKYLVENPINKQLRRKELIDEEPQIFTPDELSRLLEVASPELIPVLAIGAFCGVRMAELLRLEWRDVNFHTGFVEVKGRKAKSRSHRKIEMRDNLVAWLTPYAGRTGLIWTGTQGKFYYALGCASRAAGLVEWPDNGLRHSYASYHLALHENENKLALDLGHAGSNIIFSHYRAMATKGDAERYWNIRPSTPPANILPISSAIA